MQQKTVNIRLPIPESVDGIEDVEIEKYFQHLIDTGYATKEEVLSFIMFQTTLSTSTPFLLDYFLSVYRSEDEGHSDI